MKTFSLLLLTFASSAALADNCVRGVDGINYCISSSKAVRTAEQQPDGGLKIVTKAVVTTTTPLDAPKTVVLTKTDAAGRMMTTDMREVCK